MINIMKILDKSPIVYKVLISGPGVCRLFIELGEIIFYNITLYRMLSGRTSSDVKESNIPYIADELVLGI